MARPSVYHVTHTYSDKDRELYIKTLMPFDELRKLIHIWQVKLFDMCDTMDFNECEMVEILETFGVSRISKEDKFTTYYDLDLYLVWEYGAAHIPLTEEDMTNPKFINDEAIKIMNRVYKETLEYYEREMLARRG